MKNEILINSLILFFSIVICLIILDIFIAIAQPITTIYRYSPYTDYLLKPNKNISFISREFNIIISTNVYGLRDDDFNLSKSYKFLLLGDSFVFGHGVNHSDGFEYLLEEKLNNYFKDEIIIINAGHNGYDTRREYEYLKNYGIYFDPDIIIIAFVLNDVYSNSGEYWFSPIPIGISRYIPLRSIGVLIEYLKNPKKLLYKLGFKNTYKEIDHFNCLRRQFCENGWKKNYYYLNQIRNFVDDKILK